MRILLIEDDELLGDGVKTGLSQHGFTVDWVTDGQTGLEALQASEFDTIILDLGLPKLSGEELLREMRTQGNKSPVLILTAKDTVQDCVALLDSGADDYMTKPFDITELAARLRALQRRQIERGEPTIEYKGLVLDPAAHTVVKNGELMTIPRREFALLHKLLVHQGQVLSRQQLMQSIYTWDQDIDSNALEVHIHNLRKKLDADFIKTIRGVGYMIEKSE